MMKKFVVAWNGLVESFKDLSVQIQVCFAIFACFVSYFMNFTYQENINLVLCIGLVIATEILNTGIEKICDLITLEKNDKIRQIKDISAGAVLFVSIIALIIGCMMVMNHL